MKNTKTSQMVKYLEEGSYKKALRIAKGFRLGFSKKERVSVMRGYECLVRPKFYKMLGYNTEHEIDRAIYVLKDKYGECS